MISQRIPYLLSAGPSDLVHSKVGELVATQYPVLHLPHNVPFLFKHSFTSNSALASTDKLCGSGGDGMVTLQ